VKRLHAGAPQLRVGLAVALMSALAATGCGSGGPVMGRVSGTVTYQGKPIEKGTVTFISTDSERPNATGDINGGSYTIQTTEPGDGAVVGDYKVVISDIDPNLANTALPGAPVKKAKSALPKKYLNADTSELTVKVESGSQTKDFDLQ
jgi:hypothetical protein